MVTVKVGALRIKYHLHRTALVQHSEYFRTALNGQWKESEDGIVFEDIETGTCT